MKQEVIRGDLIKCRSKVQSHDNKSIINIVHNPIQHDWTKHVEVNRHFIKEKLYSGLICTPYVSTKPQLANVLTKELASH